MSLARSVGNAILNYLRAHVPSAKITSDDPFNIEFALGSERHCCITLDGTTAMVCSGDEMMEVNLNTVGGGNASHHQSASGSSVSSSLSTSIHASAEKGMLKRLCSFLGLPEVVEDVTNNNSSTAAIVSLADADKDAGNATTDAPGDEDTDNQPADYADEEDGYGYGDGGDEDYEYFMSREASDALMGGAGGGGMPPLLCKAVARVKAVFGDANVNARPIGSGYWISVMLTIDGISPSVAKAWGVRLDVPVEIRIEFDSHHFPGTRPPKVKLFQHYDEEVTQEENSELPDAPSDSAAEHQFQNPPPPSAKKKRDGRFPLGQHLLKATSQYLSRRWSSSADGLSFQPPATPNTFWDMIALAEQDYTDAVTEESLASSNSPSSSSSSDAALRERSRGDLLGSLQRMGFADSLARIGCLMHTEAANAAGYLLRIATKASLLGDSSQKSAQDEQNERMFGALLSKKPDLGDLDLKKFVPYPLPTTTSSDRQQAASAPKSPSDIAEGFLLHVCQYIAHRIPTASSYCVLCDMPHLFDSSMLRPAVCARQLCTFAYTSMGVGLDAAESVATDMGVLDLLVTIFRIAVKAAQASAVGASIFGAPANTNAGLERADRMLTPYPSVEDPQKRGRLALDPMHRDYKALADLIVHLPSTREIIGSAGNLASALGSRHPLAYPLFDWIISSNRSYLVRIDPKHLIPGVGATHQYLLLTSTPEKEGRFAELKKRFGSQWAFHGSGANNWHSILRNGLMNMSNTSYQLNGAAHGSGVYFAQELATSMGYSSVNRFVMPNAVGDADANGKKPFDGGDYLGESMRCVALCEIIKNKYKDHQWCWTVQEEDAIMTRFFFVYDGVNSVTQSAVSTKDAQFISDVQKTADYYGLK